MRKATLVTSYPDGRGQYRGEQYLWLLSEPYHLKSVGKCSVHVSYVVTSVVGNESFVYPSDPYGNVINWETLAHFKVPDHYKALSEFLSSWQ